MRVTKVTALYMLLASDTCRKGLSQLTGDQILVN